METPTSSIVSTGDLGGQKVEMTIDSSAMAHIMSVLTDLYSDPMAAVIREYATNARDAHIEAVSEVATLSLTNPQGLDEALSHFDPRIVAGEIPPIEIITPNGMSPYFKVIDHGVGLSVDDITDMYSKYGASTKRGTNTQVGMLGLGAKSALTLVSQFNLTSVKNGVKIFVSISRNAEGAGQMEIIDTVSTTESNGVEISIPINRSVSFMEKLSHFFRFWQPGTVLVDGKEPEFLTGRPVGDNFIINRSLNSDYVVMGGVAYPVPDKLYNGGYNPLGVVAFVEIGDINFTPAREALHYTPKTKATVDRLKAEFANGILVSANKDIDESVTYGEAWQKAKEWRANFGVRLGTLVYKGIVIPSDIPFGSKHAGTISAKRIEGKEFSLTPMRGRQYTNWIRSIDPTMMNTHIFITGFAATLKMSPVQREKALIYATSKNLTAQRVVAFAEDEFISDADHLKFLDGIHIVKWEEIAKIKIPRNSPTNRNVRTDPYDLFTGSYSGQQVRTLDLSKPITYYSTAEQRNPVWLKEMFPDAQIVILSANRWEKFKRDFPTAKHYKDMVAEHQKELLAKLTLSDKILWHYEGARYLVRGMDASRVDDPEAAQFINVVQGNSDYSDAAKLLKKAGSRGVPLPNIEVPDNPLTKYLLLGNLARSNSEHAYWYMNTYYKTLNP